MKRLTPSRKISPIVVILGLVSLFTDIASEMLYPVSPLFLRESLGASMALVGLLEGAAEITAGFLKGYFGSLSDRLRKRAPFVTLGYGLSAFTKSLPGFFPFLPVVVLTRITDRVGKGIRTAPRDALLSLHARGNTGAVFGLHRALDTTGAALGPLISLAFLSFFPGNYRLIFLAAFLPSMVSFALTFLVRDRRKDPRPQDAEAIEQKEETSEDRRGVLAFLSRAPSSYRRLLPLFVLFALVNTSDVFLILRLREAGNSDSAALGGYIFYNILYALFSYPVGLLADRLGKKEVIFGGLILFSGVYLGFALSGNPAVLFSLFALYALYAAATEGVGKAWIADLVEKRDLGSAIGLYSSLSGLAMMAGSYLTGLLWDLHGATLPFLITSGTALLTALTLPLLKTAPSSPRNII